MTLEITIRPTRDDDGNITVEILAHASEALTGAVERVPHLAQFGAYMGAFITRPIGGVALGLVISDNVTITGRYDQGITAGVISGIVATAAGYGVTAVTLTALGGATVTTFPISLGAIAIGTLAGAIIGEWTNNRLIDSMVGPECFPANTIIATDYSSKCCSSICIGDTVSVLDVSSTVTVTQIFRNITSEWLEVVWTHPETGAVEQIISTPGHRFLKHDGSYDRIIDMVDRSFVVAGAANDSHDENDSSFGGAHPFSAAANRPFGVGPDEQIVSDAWMPVGTAEIVLRSGLFKA